MISAVPSINVVRRGRTGITVAGVAVALAATLAACGGSSTKTSSAPSTTAKPGSASTAAYTSCLEQHGIPASAATQMASGPRGFFGGGRNPEAAGGGTPGTGGPAGGGTRPSLPAGVTQSSLRTATQACRSVDPNAGRFGGGQFNSAASAAYRNCLQIHGVTLPTRGAPGSSTTSTTAAGSPSSSTPGGGRGFGGLNPNDPTVQAAMQACASLRPTPGGSTTSTTAAG